GGRPESAAPSRDYLAVCDPDIADRILQVLHGDLDRFEAEYPCHGPDTERWFRMVVTPLVGGALIVHVDITGEYARVSRWLETTSSPMIELDPTGNAAFVNQAWADLQQASRRDLLGARWSAGLADAERQRLDNAVQATAADGQDRTVDIAFAADASGPRWIRFLVSAYSDGHHRLQRISLVGMDITEARRLNDQLAATAERERIAADIHDVIIQDLFALGLVLQGTPSLTQAEPELLPELTANLDRSIADLRALSSTLPSQRLSSPADLDAVLRQAELALGFRPHVRLDVDLSRLSSELATSVLPVIKEALSNIGRHARATRATVTVTEDQGDLVLQVCDNGIGMPEVRTRSSGTENIAHRAEKLGGKAQWSPAEGGGTVLDWRVPLTRGNRWNPGRRLGAAPAQS
ncbi:MAG TPA: PAS domain-containing protein, partial [Sporichthya sp.]|nr:PAS domain-containing protein [Sporichthya sp.]